MSEKQEQMVFENTKLIYFVLKKLNLYSKCDEYYDIGLIGLVKGVKTFDENKNICLSTYLFTCIKNEILTVARKKSLDTISIETEIGEDIILSDVIKDDLVIEDDVEERTMFESVTEYIEKMSKEEQFVINSYFGINGSKKLTQREIAKHLGISQVQVSRRISKIINKLKGEFLC